MFRSSSNMLLFCIAVEEIEVTFYFKFEAIVCACHSFENPVHIATFNHLIQGQILLLIGIVARI